MFFIGTACGILLGCQKTPEELIGQMVDAVGGLEALKDLRDVQFEYTYHDLAAGQRDVSLERYLFDGELSWASYKIKEKSFPDVEGELVQGYNGKESWCTVDGKPVDDERLLRMADFLRKTNYYWFTMMFKLKDPGVNYQGLGTKVIDGKDYDAVKISFDDHVGDAQDSYVVFINRETHLIDQFLFTVMDFNLSEPHLMKVEYEEVAGLKLPARRRYIKANWDAEVVGESWTEEISANIKFNNNFDRAMFDKPSAAMTAKVE